MVVKACSISNDISLYQRIVVSGILLDIKQKEYDLISFEGGTYLSRINF